MSDRILGAACVMVALAMAWFAQGYAPAIAYEPVGPRAFPTPAGRPDGFGGAWLVIKPSVVMQSVTDRCGQTHRHSAWSRFSSTPLCFSCWASPLPRP
jgi:hypothetical protein